MVSIIALAKDITILIFFSNPFLVMSIDTIEHLKLIYYYITFIKYLLIKDFVLSMIIFYFNAEILGKAFEIMFGFYYLGSFCTCLHKVKYKVGGIIDYNCPI